MAISNSVVGICAQFLRIILTFTRPISDYVLDFLYGLFMGKTKPLPPINNELLLMSAVDLAKKIRNRQVKCEDVMLAYIQRSRSVHPLINAALDERYDDALQDARDIDTFLESGRKSPQQIEKDTPLLGVPFTCKEAIGVKDLLQVNGLVWAKGRKAPEDSVAASKYRNAGAIPVTVTNVPETCFWWEAANAVAGMTKNPYDNRRTVGGSSGGEGAIITAGAALIGIGNDIAGSIRIPASFCGIYGHKPSTGTVSNAGAFPFGELDKNEDIDSFTSTGPMCRYVEDLPLLMRILTSNDQRIKFDEKVDFSKVKIYYMEEYPGILLKSISPIKNAVRKAAHHFEKEYGIKAIPFKMDELRYAFDVWECKLLETGVPPFKCLLEYKTGKVDLWRELFKVFLGRSNHTLPAIYFAMVDRREKDEYYYECLRIYEAIERKFQEIFVDDAILLLPTHPEPPPHYLMTVPKYPNIGYTCIFSILGFPSSQIPTGLVNGLPIGIQAISGRMRDHLTLAAAMELDKVFGGWRSPCPITD
ncbi:fatty-acid amide hydrolase 2-A [Parasteatoda tepidariorum]|uniref:fatty-acid amide hydrolase 2-A n=1 Tax=Parasteatoda tepidariorum TaxID=114398 RepID=UPI00077FCAD3|nr:fatty-acid amide hydrolase 2-A [Parasteatoda tepidariorum]XP_015906844.1 fatty-acid amide hydrolase 2-A [Parasteatoda tepidariorum]XP_015906846.1 fatty-acid amide hydrolase 2-A [Parasteatoda tepidariorum]